MAEVIATTPQQAPQASLEQETVANSGFYTRKQEQFYDKSLERLVELLCQRLLYHYKPDDSYPAE